MDVRFGGHSGHKFYGATTVGERGQVVIPAEARRDLGLAPADKLLVFGGHEGSLMIAKAETFSNIINRFVGNMSRLEEMIKSEAETAPQDAIQEEGE